MTLSRIVPCPHCNASLRAETIRCTKCGRATHGEVRLGGEVTSAGLRLKVELPELMRELFDAAGGESNTLSMGDLVRDTNEFLRRKRMRHRTHQGMEVEPWP